MKRTLIRYKTKPDMADKNVELIARVFEELKSAQPDGVRYLSLRLDDNSFIHFVETDAADGSSAISKSGCLQGVPERDCANVVPSRRWREVLQSSAIIAC